MIDSMNEPRAVADDLEFLRSCDLHEKTRNKQKSPPRLLPNSGWHWIPVELTGGETLHRRNKHIAPRGYSHDEALTLRS